MKPKIKSKLLPTLLACSLGITACGGGSHADGSANSSSQLVAPLTIDDAGIIPAFSDANVSTRVYFHNNSDVDIKDLEFTYEANVDGVTLDDADKKALLNLNGLNRTVRAGAKGSIPISIPKLKAGQRGTLLVTATYSYKGEKKTFQQAISFHTVATNTPGVYLSSGALASGFGNHKAGYTTLYVYGSGASGSHYKIDDNLKLDPVLGQEISGKLEGSEMVSRQVVAIELETQKLNKTNGGIISLGAQDLKTKQHSSSSQFVTILGQSEAASQAAIYQSKVPVLNTAENKEGVAYIYNAGTTDATGITIAGSSGVTTKTKSCDNFSLHDRN